MCRERGKWKKEIKKLEEKISKVLQEVASEKREVETEKDKSVQIEIHKERDQDWGKAKERERERKQICRERFRKRR